MSGTYRIGKDDVHFHDDTHHVESFLRHSNNLHAAQSYLKEAREHGKTYVYANNSKYQIRHEKGEDGKDKFSVRYAG